MIITRTPFRVSFAGGGSDLQDYYSKNDYGAVVSAAIEEYMYVVIHPYFQDKIRIKYSKTEDVETIDEIEHPIVRECLKRVQIDKGIEIASFADVPAGTGLGSSSAFAVGLLNALYAYKGMVVSKERLAREACEIEIDILGEPIGKQDQYAVVYGNINYIRFNKDESVDVSPLFLTGSPKKALEEHLCLYYVGGDRRSSSVLQEQKRNMLDDKKVQNLNRMVKLTEKLRDILYSNEINAVGNLLHEGWLLKRELATGVTNDYIDTMYERALANGAVGGKLLGAGGDGFLLLYSDDHGKLKQTMNCKTLPFKLEREGTKILFYD